MIGSNRNNEEYSENDNLLDKGEDHEKKSEKKETAVIGTLPITSLFVIIAEFAERCCYYAITAIYVIYMQDMLGFTASDINAATSAFNFGGYSFVLLGGYCADRFFGRKKTIAIFGVFYLIGLIVLTFSASPLAYADFPNNPTWAIWGFILSLVLIAFGMGGIKANVGPLMADQLTNATNEDIETAFRYFYWSINFGALIGMLVSPLLRRVDSVATPSSAPTLSGATPAPTSVCSSTDSDPYDGYFISYATFTGIFIFGIVAFLWGYSRYVGFPPSGSLISKSFKVMYHARRERIHQKKEYFALPEDGKHWLDWAKFSNTGPAPTDEFIAELQQTLRTLLVFSVFPIYWLLYLQMTNTLVEQGSMMYLPGNITPDQLAAFDPLFLVFLIPLFDSYIFPYFRQGRVKLGPITRMTIGFTIASFSMFIATGLQAAVNSTGTFVNCNGTMTFQIDNNQLGIDIFTQVPIYLCIAVSEIFASITSLEYAYSAAPKSMKSLVMAYSLFQTALGSLLGLILTPVVTEQNFIWLFLSFGVAMLFFTIIFYFAFRSYE